METNQKGSIDILLVGVVLLMMLLFSALLISGLDNSTRPQNHEECMDWAVVAIPDPNQTSERMELLKSCLGE